MKKVIALFLVLLGIAGGGAAGMFLKPPPPEEETTDQKVADGDEVTDDGQPPDSEFNAGVFVKVGRQTIIPVVEGGETQALMLFELAVDVVPGENDLAFEMEPRLRDAFLRELFQMSHTGAFMTTFTDDRVIEELRQNLIRAAKKELGASAVNDVLILDVMRQEM